MNGNPDIDQTGHITGSGAEHGQQTACGILFGSEEFKATLGTDGRTEFAPKTESISNQHAKVTTKNVLAKLEAQEYKCALTGEPLTPETASLDHIVPVSEGGDHTMKNVQILHRTVNRMKGALSQEEFFDWCRQIVRSQD